MTILVPDSGENLILGMLVNKTAPQDLVLRLFKNNITPSETDTAATYTEADFTGYSAITLTGASWGSPSGGSIAYAQQTFTASGSPNNDVYGYYYTQVTSGILVMAERDSNAPFQVRNAGETIKITPTITAS